MIATGTLPATQEKPRKSGLALQRVRRRSELEPLREEWNELLAASPSDGLFLSWEWISAYCRHLTREGRLDLLLVRDGGRLVAAAPFLSQFPWLGRALLAGTSRLVGADSIGADYLDVIIRPGHEEAAAASLAGYLSFRRTVVSLGQLPMAANARRIARLLCRRGYRLEERRVNVCPVIDLTGHTWESYLGTLGSSHRQNVRRRLRALHRDFDVRLQRVASEDELPVAFDALLTLHQDRWSSRGGSNALTKGAVVAFHRDFARTALERGWLRLFVLWLDGKPAAALYGFMYRGRFLYYQSGFHRDHEKHAVGLVTMGLAIQSAIEDGATEYDLLHGGEPYKRLWSRQVRQLTRVDLFPPSLPGRLRQLAGRARRSAREWLAPGPASLLGEAWLRPAARGEAS